MTSQEDKIQKRPQGRHRTQVSPSRAEGNGRWSQRPSPDIRPDKKMGVWIVQQMYMVDQAYHDMTLNTPQ